MRAFIWGAESEGMTDFKRIPPLPVSRPFGIKAQGQINCLLTTKDPRNATFTRGWLVCSSSVVLFIRE